MKNDIVKFNSNALTSFNKTLASANNLLDANTFHDAVWFDTPEKRLTWWFELEPQWRKAFTEAVFFQKRNPLMYRPSDKELETLFAQTKLFLTGAGHFRHRNVSPCISFQLDNLTGLTNLTNVQRLELDYNRNISCLQPLSKLHNLWNLTIDNNSIKDLTPLMELQNLSSICIWNNQIEDLDPLAALPQLDHLVLGLYDEGNPIVSYNALKHMRKMRVLDLAACPKFDLALLDNMDNLMRISLQYCGYTAEEVAPLEARGLWVRQ